MERLAILDYIIAAVAVIMVIYAAIANLYLPYHYFTLYAALPTIVALIILYFLHRYIYKIRNSQK